MSCPTCRTQFQPALQAVNSICFGVLQYGVSTLPVPASRAHLFWQLHRVILCLSLLIDEHLLVDKWPQKRDLQTHKFTTNSWKLPREVRARWQATVVRFTCLALNLLHHNLPVRVQGFDIDSRCSQRFSRDQLQP